MSGKRSPIEQPSQSHRDEDSGRSQLLATPASQLRTGLSALVTRIHELGPKRTDLTAMARSPRQDLIAGVTVAVVALPLALAFGISSGMGASAGLVTAIVAGLLAAFFGGSHVQVSGPTGAMTVVLVPIFLQYGPVGVLTVGFLAGVTLVVMAFTGIGRMVKFIPLPVIEGFTVGIAVIIAIQQVPAMLGISVLPGDAIANAGEAVRAWVANPNLTSLAIAGGVAAVMLIGSHLRPGLPAALIAVCVATLGVQAFAIPASRIGEISLTWHAPSLDGLDLTQAGVLLVPAVAVAALAALESLLSATVADGMTVSERHDPDRELFGQGIANVATSLVGGVASTAAIARTAVNVRAGARSRLASIIHALVLLLMTVALAPVVSLIPLAALAGVLIATAARMVEVSSVRALLRSTRRDAAVLVVTTVTTIALDLATAVLVGIGVAGVLALRELARSADLEQTPLSHFPVEPNKDVDLQQRALLDDHIVAFRLDGPLFFGAAHTALLALSELSRVEVVVLRLSHVVAMDATGARVLGDTIDQLSRRGITVLLSGLTRPHESTLNALGVLDSLIAENHLFEHTPDAIAHARSHVSRIHT